MNSVPADPDKTITALVFDSGVGGLSIASEIQKKLPSLRIVYASDNAFFPYGTKGEAELIARVEKVLRVITQAHAIDMIVIACNTASTLALAHCRQVFDLPIVGVVPAIKPASQLTRSGVIGLLATPATIARPYTDELIREYASDHQVIRLGSSELVTLAERKLRGRPVEQSDLDLVLSGFFRQSVDQSLARKMDTLVLACTHFPLMRDEIKRWFTQQQMDILLIDSGEAIARRVEFLLSERTDHMGKTQPEHLALFTQETAEAKQLLPALSSHGFSQLVFLPVE